VAPVPGPEADEALAETGEGAITKADFDVDPKGERKARCPAGWRQHRAGWRDPSRTAAA
jgi:hypothetical protein